MSIERSIEELEKTLRKGKEIPLELNISCPNITHHDHYLEGGEIFRIDVCTCQS